jgi:excisionase family DNA binding protein
MPNDKVALDLMTAEQIGSKLAVKPSTIYRWARAGRIPAIRMTDRVIRFSYQSVLAAFQNSMGGR